MDHHSDTDVHDADSPLSPARFANAFTTFLEAVVSERRSAGTLLGSVIVEHLGSSAGTTPILGDEFDAFEQPNVQVALDAMLAVPGRTHRLYGISTPP
ncbi:MAG: hypothetical protein QM589_14150 [Thermomicrobiales bacterium]